MRRRRCSPASLAVAAVLLLLVACCTRVSGQETSSHSTHDSHDTFSHGEEEELHFEAAAVYDIGAGTNSFVVVPAGDSSSGDDEMTFAFMVVPAGSADLEGLEGAEEDAETGA